ncbi:MAG: GatB/YqeY domain-containing protein [Terriglobia bacterium]
MPIQEQIQAELTAAMKAREALKIDVLRGIKTALKLKEVEKMRALSDPEALQVIHTLVKQRKDSIEQFAAGGRMDLVSREEAELRILEGYLPAPIGEQDIRTVVLEVISELQANSSKDIGRVMKTVMGRFTGKNVDGKLVNEIVRSQLGN